MIQGVVFPAPGVFTSLDGYAYTAYTTLNINDQSYIISGTLNPTVTAVDAPESSLYLRATGSGGQLFIKNDDGNTTNWTSFLTGNANSFETIQAPSGGAIVAESSGDTWTISTTDGTVVAVNNPTTDTTDFSAVVNFVDTNSYGSPSSLSNSGNISAPTPKKATVYVVGNGGAVTGITISAGSGSQDLELIGTSDTNTVQLVSSSNVLLSGTCVLKAGSILRLRWVAGLAKWVEVTRNEII